MTGLAGAGRMPRAPTRLPLLRSPRLSPALLPGASRCSSLGLRRFIRDRVDAPARLRRTRRAGPPVSTGAGYARLVTSFSLAEGYKSPVI